MRDVAALVEAWEPADAAGIDGRLWPCKQLDSYSFAYDLLKKDGTVRTEGLVDADTWINHPRAERYEVYESSTLIAKIVC